MYLLRSKFPLRTCIVQIVSNFYKNSVHLHHRCHSWPKLGQIGPYCDKNGTLLRSVSVHFGSLEHRFVQFGKIGHNLGPTLTDAFWRFCSIPIMNTTRYCILLWWINNWHHARFSPFFTAFCQLATYVSECKDFFFCYYTNIFTNKVLLFLPLAHFIKNIHVI